jgi:hypothetical protein
MPKVVTAKGHKKQMDRGGSRSQLMACEDASGMVEYVVKFRENPQGVRVLVNELVAGSCAGLLAMPCPEVALVEVTDDLINAEPNLAQFVGRAVSPGMHYGIKYVRNAYRKPPPGYVAKIANPADIASVIAFDAWTLNSDRNNEGNYLILNPDFAPRRIYYATIDHGHCFGQPNWDETIVSKIDDVNLNFPPELAAAVTGGAPFEEILRAIEAVTEADISAIIGAIPSSWDCPQGHRDALRRFLCGRAKKVRQVIDNNKAKFPGWR